MMPVTAAERALSESDSRAAFRPNRTVTLSSLTASLTLVFAPLLSPHRRFAPPAHAREWRAAVRGGLAVAACTADAGAALAVEARVALADRLATRARSTHALRTARPG